MGASWHLSHIEVINIKTNQHWLFPCCKWLSTSQGDGQIERDLIPGSSLTALAPEHAYVVTVFTSNISGAGKTQRWLMPAVIATLSMLTAQQHITSM